MNNIVYIFLICLIVYYFSDVFKETFLVVGYNDSIIPNYTIKNLFDEETKLLDSEFSNLSLDHNFNIKSFTLFNTNIPFPFTNQFKILLLSFLKTVPRINKHILTLGDFNNIYYNDDSLGNRIFILNVNIQDSTKFTSRNIKVKFLVNNIRTFTTSDQNSNYLPTFDPNLLDKYSSLLGVILDKNGYANFTMTGIDESDPNFYLIYNQLYLMDPFITSNIDMIITKDMKTSFYKSLAYHQQYASGSINSNGIFNANSVGSN
jgi:hypothetical protein